MVSKKDVFSLSKGTHPVARDQQPTLVWAQYYLMMNARHILVVGFGKRVPSETNPRTLQI